MLFEPEILQSLRMLGMDVNHTLLPLSNPVFGSSRHELRLKINFFFNYVDTSERFLCLFFQSRIHATCFDNYMELARHAQEV